MYINIINIKIIQFTIFVLFIIALHDTIMLDIKTNHPSTNKDLALIHVRERDYGSENLVLWGSSDNRKVP